MKEWWLKLGKQEQLAMLGAVAAACVLLLYLALWQPFSKKLQQQQDLLVTNRVTLEWMQEQMGEINRLKQQHSAVAQPGGNENLLTLVDKTAKQQQIRNLIQRIKPQGDNGVQLWIEQAPFSLLLPWMASLQKQSGITITALDIERQEKPGLVNLRLALQSGGKR